MKKSLLFMAFAGLALGANAQDATYNFFDPADCDADGWLWLDSQEKIDKYVGGLDSDKKIKLVHAQYEFQDPNFPDDYYTPESYADPDLKGYNQLGEEGGEGSVTGGIVLPAAQYDPEEDWWPTDGGGILVAMPDCAVFELYISQSMPEVMTEIYMAKKETNDPGDCEYLWDDDYSFWDDSLGPVIKDYAGFYHDMQDIQLDYNMGDGEPDIWSLYGAKGEQRTAYIANYTYTEEATDNTCPMYIQGIHILTYTEASQAGVKSLQAENVKINIKGGVISLPNAAQISVYTPSGVKVASTYDSSLDCTSLKGIYFVRVGNKTVKAVF
ncbi:MAG: hypothetical protein J1F67_05900 [Muribaculaceae bacterium]|nr:hypothetical protein [Muribaculaceae bacterium]